MDLRYIDELLDKNAAGRITANLKTKGFEDINQTELANSALDAVSLFLEFTGQDSLPPDSLSLIIKMITDIYVSRVTGASTLDEQIEEFLSGEKVSLGDTSVSFGTGSWKKSKKDEKEQQFADDLDDWRIRAVKWRILRW